MYRIMYHEKAIEIKTYQFDIIINPSNSLSSSFFHISHPSEKLDEKEMSNKGLC